MPDLSRRAVVSNHVQGGRPGSADLLGNMDNGSEFGDSNKNDSMTVPITKGGMGFGFTIADSGFGQKVKKILDRPRCKSLREGDVLTRINDTDVRNMNHSEVVQVLKECPRGQEAAISIRRGLIPSSSNSNSPVKSKYKSKDGSGGLKPKSGFLFRSKTPTAELYSTQEKEKVPNRPKTPLVDTRNFAPGGSGRAKTPTALTSGGSGNSNPFSRNDATRASLGGGAAAAAAGGNAGNSNYAYGLNEQMSAMNLGGGEYHTYYNQYQQGYEQQLFNGYNYSSSGGGGGGDYGQPLMLSPGKMYAAQQQSGGGGQQYYNGYTYNDPYGYTTRLPPMTGEGYSPAGNYRAGSLPRGSGGSVSGRKESTSFEHSEPLPGNMTRWPRPERRPADCVELTITLNRQESGFGFRVVGGTEEGSQVGVELFAKRLPRRNWD